MIDPDGTLPLEAWMGRQHAVSVRRMAASISAVDLVKRRPGFGQTIVPAPGSVVASPVMADYDPDPDYFFHWLRDSALVMDAAVRLAGDGDTSADWAGHLHAFVGFSLGLNHLRGADTVARGAHRRNATPDFLKFVRPDAELSAIRSDSVPGEVRYNPDGTLDTIRWSRPQHDGPALRALTLMRADAAGLGCEGLEALLLADLDYTAAHAGAPCIDLWEDIVGRHYYTQIVQFAALERGAARVDQADSARAERWRTAAATLRESLDACWSEADGIYLSHKGADPTLKQPDIAIVLGVLHAGIPAGRHSPRDDRVLATLDRLAAEFDAAYPINRDRPPGHGAALGRYLDDSYYSGGAYHFATLAAAELCYRRAAGRATDEEAAGRLAAGDGFMATVRRFTPDDGALAEQFDRNTGAPASAKDLAWCHAALIMTLAARRAACDRPAAV